MSIGSRLQHLRHEYNFSTESVAKFLKITPTMLNDLEHDKKTLTVSQLEKICDLYGVDENHILNNEQSTKIHWFDEKDLDLKTIYQMNTILRNIEFLLSLTDI